MKKKADNLHNAYAGLSKILLEFNLNFDDFCKTLREHLVLETYKSSHTVTRTSLKSGIDRRIVSSIIKKKKQYHKPPLISKILKHIERVAKRNNMLVNKTGTKSIEKIMHKVAPGAMTINSIVVELCALGCIEDMGTHIKFISSDISNSEDQNRALRDFSTQLEHYVNSMLENLQDYSH